MTKFHYLTVHHNVCITMVCFNTNFEINFIILIKPFSAMNKKSRQKYKNLENKKSFSD